jgi:hypothetical protein
LMQVDLCIVSNQENHGSMKRLLSCMSLRIKKNHVGFRFLISLVFWYFARAKQSTIVPYKSKSEGQKRSQFWRQSDAMR